MTGINSRNHFTASRISRLMTCGATALVTTGVIVGFATPAFAAETPASENDTPVFALEDPVASEVNENTPPDTFSTVTLQPVLKAALTETTEKPAPLVGTAVTENNLNQGATAATGQPLVDSTPSVNQSAPPGDSASAPTRRPATATAAGPKATTPAPQQSLKVPAAPAVAEPAPAEPAVAAPAEPAAALNAPAEAAPNAVAPAAAAPATAHSPAKTVANGPAAASLSATNAMTGDMVVTWVVGAAVAVLAAIGLMFVFARKESRRLE
ncbi:MAG: hypothetical protein MSC45_01355 [Mobiluncus sp.]|uniref:hypothetical protein n=1 Tax=Mobiluncus sp. TaxID=47293 RepID=UPI00258320E0|nr:hypothetical protein [Mobiluncus sp.]MCI6583699.1 hypothetical protein [Mobiluncus sp.]